MYKLGAVPRTVKNPRALRRQGLIPGVVYGQGVHRLIQVQQGELERLLGQITRSSRIKLALDGEEWEAFIKEIQYHPLTDRVIHIDFYLPSPGQEVTIEVPLLLRGDPQGRRLGGVLRRLQTAICVRGLPEQIPEKLEVDVSGLGLGETLRVRDLPPLEGVKVLTPPETPLATVKVPRREVTVEAVAEAEAGAPAAEAAPAPEEGKAAQPGEEKEGS
ncbi:MAG: 50S ribosomal protein L25 [Candidatus Bipolaricaulia bacterium]